MSHSKQKTESLGSDVAAIIVLFNPDMKVLTELLLKIKLQVSCIILVDNTPSDNKANSLEVFISNEHKGIVYIKNGDNLGIAAAQNIAIDYAVSNGYGHLLFLDQDSSVGLNFVDRLLTAERMLLLQGMNVGAIGPLYKDVKSNNYVHAIRHRVMKLEKVKIDVHENMPVVTDYLISSGSFIRTSVIKSVGNMKANLFIDWVDIEWCLRAQTNGFSNFIISSIHMEHNIGDSVIKIAGKSICMHDDIRNYYIVRNAVHLLFDPNMKIGWKISVLYRIPLWLIFYSYFTRSEKRMRTLKFLLIGVWDGITGRLGKCERTV